MGGEGMMMMVYFSGFQRWVERAFGALKKNFDILKYKSGFFNSIIAGKGQLVVSSNALKSGVSIGVRTSPKSITTFVRKGQSTETKGPLELLGI